MTVIKNIGNDNKAAPPILTDDDGTILDQGKNDSSSLPTSPLLVKCTKERRQKTILIVLASCSIFLFAGSFYGWGPMQLLLEENGNFASTCTTNQTNTEEDDSLAVCSEQTAALLNCRFVSQLTVLTGPMWGYLSDLYGGQVLTYSMTISITTGLALLMIAVEYPNTIWDYILYVSFLLLGIGSTCGGLLTVETGILFRDGVRNKTQSRIISLLNALFDAGAMTYLGLWGIEKLSSTTSSLQENSINLISILGGYLTLAVFCLGGYAFFFRKLSVQTTEHNDDIANVYHDDRDNSAQQAILDKEESASHNPGRLSNTIPLSVDESDSELLCNEEDTKNDEVSNDDSHQSRYILNQERSRLTPCEVDEEGNTYDNNNLSSHTEIAGPSSNSSYTPISKRSVSGQLRSQAYMLLCIFFSFHMVSNVWTLTTARDFLKYLGDDEYGNRYLSIFTLMTPVSLLALPFQDVAVHKFGFSTALQGVNLLGLIHGIIKVSTTDLNVQILGFVIFSFFRCFLFSVTFSCLASFTSPNATGRAVGTMYVVSGVASFVNIGLANLAVEGLNGNFFVPNLIFVVMTLPMVYVSCVIGKSLNRDRQGKEHPEGTQLLSTT